MATIQQLLDDVSLRYRHSFTTAQVLVWMNEEQEELFQIFEIDSPPYAFTLVADQYLYPIPDGVDIDRIKVINVQVNDNTDPTFEQLNFRRNDDYVDTWSSTYWYTIIEDNFFIHLPSDSMYASTRYVYIYCDSQPTVITSSNLSVEPSVPLRYQEILKLGTLERIAAARKDLDMKSNFYNDKQEKIIDMEWRMRMQEPEWISPTDVMPRPNGRYQNYRRPIYITQTE